MNLVSSHEIARRAQISYRQLDLWVKSGRIAPAVEAYGSGTRRKWHEWQVGPLVQLREELAPKNHWLDK